MSYQLDLMASKVNKGKLKKSNKKRKAVDLEMATDVTQEANLSVVSLYEGIVQFLEKTLSVHLSLANENETHCKNAAAACMRRDWSNIKHISCLAVMRKSNIDNSISTHFVLQKLKRFKEKHFHPGTGGNIYITLPNL